MKRMIQIMMAGVVGFAFQAARGQVVATGGTVTNYVENGTNFTAHIFTTVGTTNLNVAVGGNVEVLVVGGGGGGGKGYYGGGGGAGGLIYSNAFALEAGSNYTVMVGDGGAGATFDTSDGGNGFASRFGETLVAYGGGGGASRKSGAAANGGSGGGGSMKDTAGGNAIQPPNGFGSAGATCDGSHYGGGGGGAGATPSFGANTIGCPGGDGRAYSISGKLTYYAGGGGGGARGSSDSASSGSTAGGLGGGGRGGRGYSGTPTYLPDPGVNGLGGGGGGGGNNSDNGANGGSGIVIVRYPCVSDADALLIHNLPVSDLTDSSATFNGMLMNTGASATAVSVLWGTADGGTEWGTWANTNWFNDGYPNPAWTNNTPFSTNITLNPGTSYFYTFGASNATTHVVAPSPIGFRTLSSGPTTWYAATNGTDNGIWTNWATAGTNLQAILDVAADGDTILMAGHTFWLNHQIAWTTAGLTIRGGYEADPGGASPANHDPEQWPTVLARSGAGGNHRVMYIDGANNSTLEHVTLTGGNVHTGAGLHVNNSDNVVLAGCRIEHNHFEHGHNADRQGGGMYASGSRVTLTNCIVRNNIGHNRNREASGGGIWSSGSLTLIDSQVVNNLIQGSTWSRGGGINFNGQHLTLRNVLLSGNVAFGKHANSRGGGLNVQAGTVNLNHCTIADNSHHGIGFTGGAIAVSNSIVWGNWWDIEGAAVSVNYSLVGDADYPGMGNIGGNPLFEYGYYLADGSPCIGQGFGTAGNAGLEAYTTRIDGAPYASSDNDVSMGWHYGPDEAFDLTYATMYVSTTGDDEHSGTAADQPFRTITKALAMARDGSRIYIAQGDYTEDGGESFPLAVQSITGLQILGDQEAHATFDADGVAARVMELAFAHRARMQNIRLINGSRPEGAGLYLDNSQNVLLSETIVASNAFRVSRSTSSVYGGGIHLERSSLTLDRCTVHDNASVNNNNQAVGGGVSGDGILSIHNSIMADNSAYRHGSDTWGRGGAIWFDGTDLSLRNVLVTGNRADAAGDGIFFSGAAATIENVTVVTNAGQGLFVDGGDVSVYNSIFWDNGLGVTGSVAFAVTHSNIEGEQVHPGEGNLNSDPLFVHPEQGNYRLQTRKGRRHHETDNWIHDEVTSPAIDAGTNRDWHADAVDLDGAPRLQRGRYGTAGIVVDLGAYEQTSRPRGTLIRLQ